MAKFEITETDIVVKAKCYHVEAETAEEALNLYCEKLAGTLMPVRQYTRGLRKDEKDDVVVNPNPIN